MRPQIFTVILLVSFVLAGCEQVDLEQLSDDDIKRISDQVIVCESPYIRHGAGCCLDENDNVVCDDDEPPAQEDAQRSTLTRGEEYRSDSSDAEPEDQIVLSIPKPPQEPIPEELEFEKPLRSEYFSSDDGAQAFAASDTSFDFPEENNYFKFGFEDDLSWRVVNAFQYAGYEEAGVPWGQQFTSQDMIALDDEVLEAEDYVRDSANRFSFYRDVSGPDFKDNLPQEFAASLIASTMGLYNAGDTDYFTFTEDCMWASFVPQMCGALVDMGTGGAGNCKDASSTLVEPLTIQTPELFGFNNVRRAISAEEYPKKPFVSTFSYAVTLTHEFAHDLDSTIQSSVNKKYPRSSCTGSVMDTSEGPFSLGGFLSSDDTNDYVSQYAKGDSTYSMVEDMAESVTAYMLLPEYFRQRAENSDLLQQKYDYIKSEFFSGVEFKTTYLSEGVQYAFPEQISTFADENSLERFSFAEISTYEDSVLIGACPIPSCATPKQGCYYEDSDELDAHGCPAYPCGTLTCDEVSEGPAVHVRFSQGGETIEKTVSDGQSISFSLQGTSYSVSILVLSQSSQEVKLLINGQITDSLGAGESQDISGIQVAVTDVVV